MYSPLVIKGKTIAAAAALAIGIGATVPMTVHAAATESHAAGDAQVLSGGVGEGERAPLPQQQGRAATQVQKEWRIRGQVRRAELCDADELRSTRCIPDIHKQTHSEGIRRIRGNAKYRDPHCDPGLPSG